MVVEESRAIPTLAHPQPPPLVSVKGSHRAIGRQIGEACAEQVRRSVANTQALIAQTYEVLQLTWEGARLQARKYLPFAQERYPQYVEELWGLAEGAGVDFDDLMVVNALEGVAMDALHLAKCTSLAVNGERSAEGHVLVAHNEDWLPDDEADVYLVHAAPDDEPPWLAMTYGGLLPNIGFNACGIAQCCDTVYPNDVRIGIPRVIVSRAVLAARDLAEAMRAALAPKRAAGYAHLLAHESGELYVVEVSARRFALLYGEEGHLVHTNHYLDPAMQAIEEDSDELISTRLRYHRARRLLRSAEKVDLTLLQHIQRDHLNFPNSICNHSTQGETPLEREKTICALIMDLTAKVLHLAWGNPCSNRYFTYSLA